MENPNLAKYISHLNIYRIFAKKEKMDVANLSLTDKEEILARVESDLSPENISCDGSCSVKQIKQKRVFLAAVLKELNNL